MFRLLGTACRRRALKLPQFPRPKRAGHPHRTRCGFCPEKRVGIPNRSQALAFYEIRCAQHSDGFIFLLNGCSKTCFHTAAATPPLPHLAHPPRLPHGTFGFAAKHFGGNECQLDTTGVFKPPKPHTDPSAWFGEGVTKSVARPPTARPFPPVKCLTPPRELPAGGAPPQWGWRRPRGFLLAICRTVGSLIRARPFHRCGAPLRREGSGRCDGAPNSISFTQSAIIVRMHTFPGGRGRGQTKKYAQLISAGSSTPTGTQKKAVFVFFLLVHKHFCGLARE